jgi:nucleotide-binding universal stress UspA family protein
MKQAKKILVALKTVEQAAELTELACRMAARGTSLLLVHVIELPDPTPLDADVPDLEKTAHKILGAAERIVRRNRMKPQRLIIRAHGAGGALLDELKMKKIDLAVLSYHHKRTISEVVFGTTAKHLVQHAPCHLLLSVPPRD